ncbi:MAG: hypothetical protein N2D54_13135, partial [Chloroflexota bacterium]
VYMDTKQIGLWSFLIGLGLAMVSVFIKLGDWVAPVLIIMGILVGIFHESLREQLVFLGVTYLVLTASAASVNDLSLIGPLIKNIAKAWANFLGPVALSAFLFWGAPMLIGTREE